MRSIFKKRVPKRIRVKLLDTIKHERLLSKRRYQVYQILSDQGPMTGSQCSDEWKLNRDHLANSETVRNRITELIKMGAVEKVGEHTDLETGKSVSVFDVTDSLPMPYKKNKTRAQQIRELKAQLNESVDLLSYARRVVKTQRARKKISDYIENVPGELLNN